MHDARFSSPPAGMIGGRYELLETIGQGGHGVVCRALDRQTGRQVAVKMLTDAAARDPQYAERLAREQHALLTLQGTNAVRLLDMCRSPRGALCLVMELLEGRDLEAYLAELEARQEWLAADRVVEVIEPIVDTLARAHASGILHRDLKPANIYLVDESAGGGVRLLDFGLARLKSGTPLTAMGTIMGSPSYIAPEVWKGNPELLDHRVDVYSLGVIIFRALAGRLPFEGESLYEKFELATTAPRPSLHALRPDLPPVVDAWVQQALAVEPAQRFESVGAMWSALLAALQRDGDAPAVGRALSAALGRARALVEAARPRSLAAVFRAATAAVRKATTGSDRPPQDPAPAAERPAMPPQPARAEADPALRPWAPTVPKVRPPPLPASARPQPELGTARTAQVTQVLPPPVAVEGAKETAQGPLSAAADGGAAHGGAAHGGAAHGGAAEDAELDRQSMVSEWLAGSELRLEPAPPEQEAEVPAWIAESARALGDEPAPETGGAHEEPSWLGAPEASGDTPLAPPALTLLAVDAPEGATPGEGGDGEEEAAVHEETERETVLAAETAAAQATVVERDAAGTAPAPKKRVKKAAKAPAKKTKAPVEKKKAAKKKAPKKKAAAKKARTKAPAKKTAAKKTKGPARKKAAKKKAPGEKRTAQAKTTPRKKAKKKAAAGDE